MATLSHAKSSPWPQNDQRSLKWCFSTGPTQWAFTGHRTDLWLFSMRKDKIVLQIVFSRSSEFNPCNGPLFSALPSLQALYQVTFQLCLSRGDIYFPVPGCGLPLWLALAHTLHWMWQCGRSELGLWKLRALLPSRTSLLCPRLACLRVRDYVQQRQLSQPKPPQTIPPPASLPAKHRHRSVMSWEHQAQPKSSEPSS